MSQSTVTTGRGLPRVRVAGMFLLAAAVALAAWWLLVRTTGTPGTITGAATTPAPAGAPATAVSPQGLETLASALNRPIYWAGTEPGATYELTQTPDGRIYVRYLPPGVRVGSPHTYLTVGTYPLSGAYAVTRRLAGGAGAVKVPVGGGGIAFYSKARPTSVYVAFPGSDYQIEVFDPLAITARKLVSSGTVRKVAARAGAGDASTTAVAVSPAGLRTLAAHLGRPLYWAGERSGSTYELSQTPEGRLYIRYLPHGVAVGATKPFLTVATYPLTDAYATTRAEARRPGAVGIKVGGGGIAFYSKQRPTSVYLAFPGVDEQIEVFDPVPAVAHATVATGKIRPVS